MRTKISENHKEDVIRLRRKGFTIPMISKKVGCSITTVWNLLQDAGETGTNKGHIPKVLQEIMLNQEGI